MDCLCADVTAGVAMSASAVASFALIDPALCAGCSGTLDSRGGTLDSWGSTLDNTRCACGFALAGWVVIVTLVVPFFSFHSCDEISEFLAVDTLPLTGQAADGWAGALFNGAPGNFHPACNCSSLTNSLVCLPPLAADLTVLCSNHARKAERNPHEDACSTHKANTKRFCHYWFPFVESG